jgi:hypothetical protein
MTASRRLALALVFVFLGVAFGCGSSSREVTSLTLTPSVADAQSYPGGQVKYSATANYNRAPSSGPIQPVLWALKPPQNVQATATISQSGVAQCNAGTTGNFMVLAYAVADPSLPQTDQTLIAGNKAALGLAQLNCP